MKYKKYKTLIENTLDKFCDYDLIYIFNEYCLSIGEYSNIIMTRNELFEFIDTFEPLDALKQGLYGNFSLSDDYFTQDEFRYIQRINAHEHITRYFLTNLACYILDNEESFGYDELQELIDEFWYSEDDLSDYN